MTDFLLACNWKLFCSPLQERAMLANLPEPKVPTIIFPSLLSLGSKHPGYQFGAQRMDLIDQGAHTGAIGAYALAELCEWVLLGHSECRARGDNKIAEKAHQARSLGLKVMLCVSSQELDTPNVDAVAYEPLWAIGTGKVATPELIAEAIAGIRSQVSQGTKLLYGGSVTPANIASIAQNADGALVGSASASLEGLQKLFTALTG